MSDINQVVIEGNLTREPELRHTPSGKAVCDIYIANNRRVVHNSESPTPEVKNQVVYVKATLWDAYAEKWGGILHTGDHVVAMGRLVGDNFERKTDGQVTKGRLKIGYVEKIILVNKKDSTTNKDNNESQEQSNE
jgi:single-strand DNA-binding protein